jgi:hypothetical protein
LILDLLGSLPEEEIGADRGAEYGDDDSEIAASETDMRKHQILGHCQPRHADHEHSADVGEERQSQPSQHRGVPGVTDKNLGEGRNDRKPGDVDNRRTVNQQMQRGGHGAEIGSEIDGVGGDKQADKGTKAATLERSDGCFRPDPVR